MFEEIKNIGKHSAIYGFGILISKAIGFFMIPLYTHYFEPLDYGVLELLDLTSYIIGYVVGMGMGHALLRYYSYYETESEKKQVTSTALLFTLVWSGIAVLILLQFRTFLSVLLFDTSHYSLLVGLLVVNLFLGLSINLCRTELRAEQRSIFFVAISLVYTLMALALNIYFVAVLQIGIKGVLYSTLITSSLINAYLVVMTLRKTGITLSLDKLRKMVRYGIPFIPTSLMLFILNFSDRYFLRVYTDLHTVGLYALGYKIGMIVSILIAGPFNLMWSAYMFQLEKKGDAKPIFARVFTYQIFAMLTVALGLSVLSREIIEVIADKAYLAAYTVIPLISLSMVLQCSNDVLQTGVLITRKTYTLPFVVGTAAATNIVLNILLIPRYSMMGAAIATALSYGVQVMTTYVVSSRIYYIPFEWKRIAILFLSGFLVYGFSTLIRFESLTMRIPLKLTGLILFPGFLLLTHFFYASELEQAKRMPSAVSRLLGRR